LAFRGKTSKIERIPPSEIPLFGEPLGKNRELLGVIGKLEKIGKNREKSVIIGIPIFPDNSG
jgi:hypothetical protein